jgi:mannose/cellobiose epimerase-like protein (N-acyl-D-glucosamine 2-epimerase family)
MITLSLKPAAERDAEDWARWFAGPFLDDWLARVRDTAGGFFDALDGAGNPIAKAPKTLLAQSRALFTLSHLAQLSGSAALTEAAQAQAHFVARFRVASGLYRRALDPDGAPTGDPADAIARSYDQTFVLLALVTFARLSPNPMAEELWQAIVAQLTDPETKLLQEDDSLGDPARHDPRHRAQNPHMHLYEACLQAFEMSSRPEWLARAQDLRALALGHFLDPESGTVTEFLTRDLAPLPGAAGERREVGHQWEWAWLLLREVELSGDPSLRETAARMLDFARRHGFASSGPMAGAVFDAVATDGTVLEPTFLLWPQTEAIKALCALHMAGQADAGEQAQALLCLMFMRWFDGRPTFVNQLDCNGATIWPQALTRLVYHVSLALSEGARARLWPGPSSN